jgi:hypothetical protein
VAHDQTLWSLPTTPNTSTFFSVLAIAMTAGSSSKSVRILIQSPAIAHPLQLIQLPDEISAAMLLIIKRLSGGDVNTRGPHE